MKNNRLLIGGAIIFKDTRKKRSWLIVKEEKDGDWEIPKVTGRKGESSVRSVIRMTGEQAGINARVLEEAGRVEGETTVNGKTVRKRTLYYLMMQRSASEIIGFGDFEWLDYSKAYKKISSRREKIMLSQAREVLKEWEKGKPRVR